MIHKIHLYLTIVLLSLVCINGLTADAHYVEMDIVKAPKAPIKVRPHFYNTDGGRGYAMSQLAVPYIRDEKIRKEIALWTWCGTPTWQYFSKHTRPTEDELRMEATLIEARIRARTK
jgi:hypothetical protein